MCAFAKKLFVADALCVVAFKPENVQTFLQALQDQATADAMKADGVKRETVNVFVLDKQLKFCRFPASGIQRR